MVGIPSGQTQVGEAWELVYEDDYANSHKFYRCYLYGDGRMGGVCFQWGRLGAFGQWSHKSFSSRLAAKAEVSKKIEEKLAKGYNMTRTLTFDCSGGASNDHLDTAFNDLAGPVMGSGAQAIDPSPSRAKREAKQEENFKSTLLRLAAQTRDEPEAGSGKMEDRLAAALAKAKANRD